MGPVERKLVAAVHTPNAPAAASTASCERWDAVGGRILKEGDALRVQWPSGTVSTETCHVAVTDRPAPREKQGSEQGSKQGSVADVPMVRDGIAYVNVALGGGIVARVDLRQEGILIEIVEDDGAIVPSTAGAALPRRKPISTKNLRLLARYMASAGDETTVALLLDAADEIDESRRERADRNAESANAGEKPLADGAYPQAPSEWRPILSLMRFHKPNVPQMCPAAWIGPAHGPRRVVPYVVWDAEGHPIQQGAEPGLKEATKTCDDVLQELAKDKLIGFQAVDRDDAYGDDEDGT